MLGKKNIKIAIVEDNLYENKSLTKYISTICNQHVYTNYSFDIKSFTTAHECIEELEDDLNIMLLDYYLFNPNEAEALNGEDVLAHVQKHCSDCKVIIQSALKNAQTVKELMHHGIYAYIDKNVSSNNRIGSVIQEILK